MHEAKWFFSFPLKNKEKWVNKGVSWDTPWDTHYQRCDESTAVWVDSRGFELFMPLNCFQNLTRDCQCKGVVTTPRACDRNPISKKLPLQTTSVCWLFVGFGNFFWLLVAHQWCIFAGEVCSPLSTGSGGNKCSAGCRAQHRLAAWIHTVAFSLFGEWTSRIIETSDFLCLSSFMLCIVLSQSLTDLFFPLHALMHCSLFQAWNTLFSCFLF